jgi:hypothetical protein
MLVMTMGLIDWFKSKYSREKEMAEIEFIKERNEIRLEAERKRRDLELGVKGKRAELEEQRLTYQIEEQKARLDEAMGEDSDDEEEDKDPDQATLQTLMPMIQQMMNKNTSQTPATIETSTIITPLNTQTSNTVAGVTFSDDEINEIYKSLPQVYKTVARSMTDQQIIEFIKGKYPAVTEECLNRMVARVKRKI